MKYIVKNESRANGDVQVGDVVYDLNKHDYGLANDDSRHTGIQYISVTFNEDGDYPSFTIPREDLEEYVEPMTETEVEQEVPLYQVRLYMKSGSIIHLYNLIEFNWKDNGVTRYFSWKHHADNDTFNLSGSTLDLDQVEAMTHKKQKSMIYDI